MKRGIFLPLSSTDEKNWKPKVPLRIRSRAEIQIHIKYLMMTLNKEL